MTACAAQTESIVEMAIAGCLRVDSEYGRAVTTHTTMPLRFSVLRSTAEIHIDDLDALDHLDVLLETIEAAFIKRNAVVHHSWCRDPLTDAVFTVEETARTGSEARPNPNDRRCRQTRCFFRLRDRYEPYDVSRRSQPSAAISAGDALSWSQEQGCEKEASAVHKRLTRRQ